jgi:CRP/FNR family transcriptional regulator
MKNSAKGILNLSCFFKIDPSYFKEMEAYSFTKRYHRGDILFYEGDMSTHLYMLLSGSVIVYKTRVSGTNVILHTLHEGEMVGEFANFGNLPYPGTAQFQENSNVLVIDFERFKTHLLMTHPEIGYAIIKCLIKKQKALMEIIHNEVILCAEQKIIKFLLENEAIFPKFKYLQMASILNTAPETLSRILSKLKNANLITIDDKRNLKIIQHKTLEEKLKLKNLRPPL